MAHYDIFHRIQHPKLAQDLLRAFNRNVLLYGLEQAGVLPGAPARVLEIGVGKGYFFSACRSIPNIEYFGFDQNSLLLDSLEGLDTRHKMLGSAPEIPDYPEPFDLIFAGFVAEHLAGGGREIYDFIRRCRRNLKPGGVIVFMVPDSEKLGMEFWNIDYTHTFPTTRRGMNQAFVDNGIEDVEIYAVDGLMTHRWFRNRFAHLLWRIIVLPYQYQLFQTIAYYLFNFRTHAVDNILFRIYALTKEENLIVYARNRSEPR